MKKKLVIAVDIDDVIVETAPLVLRHYNKEYGTSLELKDMYSKDFRKWGAPDAATAITRVDNYLTTDEFQKMPPFQEAITAIRRLADNHELHIVTGRTDFLESATKDMLDQYFPDLFREVIFTGFFGDDARSKADICQKLHTDIFIDDHFHHATEVAEAGITVLLFGDYPWNQSDSLPANMHRVKNWAAVEEYIDAKS